MKMREMCAADRPREKMMERGPGGLGNAELLAVLLRTGNREESAVELAQKLLKMADGSLVRLFGWNAAKLCSMPGIGPYKAAGVLAAFELGRRFLQEGAPVEKRPLLTPRMIYDLMAPVLKGLDHEECWVLGFNVSCYLVGRQKLTQGAMNSTAIDSRQVLKAALDWGAHSVVLMHNHPSGNPRPGPEDIRQTERVKQACSAFGIQLSDHIVFCDDSFFSFADDRPYSAQH
ncbi:MAG: DNA repair protein RadC [Bacteroidales bacterium]|nr:DNA repair protein RadC [Bacteroidales bacterium]